MLPKEDAKKELAKLIGEFQKEAENGSIDSYQEMDIRTNFIDRFFQILGWDMHSHDEILREFSTHKQKRADYVFKLNNRKVFVVEAKKASVKLDNDEGEKAFKQAISYAYFNKIKFAVVTNFRQIFVFHALSNPKTPKSNLLFVKGVGYFGFNFSEFLDNFDSLWLLSRESFLKNEMEKLLKEKDIKTSKPIDEAILGDLVEIRKLLSSDIKTHNQDLLNKYKDEANLIEEAVQRLINRLIFIRYTEDRGLEDENLLLNRLKNYQDMTSDKRLYAEIRDIFLQFNGKYNSKLFSLHEIDKEIRISEKVMENVIRILYTGIDRNQENYNFAHIGVDLLGSIYEQYLGMLLHSTEKRARLEDAKGKRKKMGIYYTPEYIVDYIVKSTIGEAAKGKSIDEILEMKILDPACGSGSFLIKAFDEVCSAVERGLKAGEKSKKFKSFQSFEGRLNLAQKIAILKSTIHGVDLDEKAVEIAQLSLLLKLLENEESHANKMLLPTMTDNIQHGNSLIDDSSIAGDNAFNWQSRFRDVFAGGGFDVVVGNPPYVDIKQLDPKLVKHLFSKYSTVENRMNLYSTFVEKSLSLLKDSGYFGFIIPNSILYNESYEKIRSLLLDFTILKKIIRLPDNVFGDAKVETIILIYQKSKEKNEKENCEVFIYPREADINSINKENCNQILYLNQNDWKSENKVFNISASKTSNKILADIERATTPLIEICDFSLGLTPYDKYKGHTKKQIDERVFHSSTKKDETYKHLLSGENIIRYGIFCDGKEYIRYGDWLGAPREKRFFTKPRIVVRQIISGKPARIYAGYTEEELYNTQIGFNIIVKDESIVLTKYVLAILNSNLMNFYHKEKCLDPSKNLFQKILIANAKKFPIKVVSLDMQKKVVALADKMLSLNKRLREPNISSSERERIKKQIEDADFEIDEAVYRLYGITEEERKVIEAGIK